MCKYSLPRKKVDIRGQVWHVLENTSVRFYLPHYIDIAVGNVFPEPALLCVILQNREYMSQIKQSRLDVQP